MPASDIGVICSPIQSDPVMQPTNFDPRVLTPIRKRGESSGPCLGSMGYLGELYFVKELLLTWRYAEPSGYGLRLHPYNGPTRLGDPGEGNFFGFAMNAITDLSPTRETTLQQVCPRCGRMDAKQIRERHTSSIGPHRLSSGTTYVFHCRCGLPFTHTVIVQRSNNPK